MGARFAKLLANVLACEKSFARTVVVADCANCLVCGLVDPKLFAKIAAAARSANLHALALENGNDFAATVAAADYAPTSNAFYVLKCNERAICALHVHRVPAGCRVPRNFKWQHSSMNGAAHTISLVLRGTSKTPARSRFNADATAWTSCSSQLREWWPWRWMSRRTGHMICDASC